LDTPGAVAVKVTTDGTHYYTNIFLSGHFGSYVSVGGTSLTNTAAQRMYLSKWDLNGDVLWVRQAGGDNSVITCNDSPNPSVYVTGQFTDPSAWDTTWLLSSGNSDIFLTRLDSAAPTHSPSKPAIVQPPQTKTNKVNMINFRGSAKEEIAAILGRLGLEPVFVAPFSTIEQLSKLSESAATVSICGTLGGYLGNGLEQQYGVPYVKGLQPHGIAGMESWLRGLGEATGKQKEAEAYINEQKERIKSELTEIRTKLQGYKAVVGMGPSFGHNYIRVLRELGVEVLWGATWHFDQHYDHGTCPESSRRLANAEDDIPVSVCDQQNFELLNLLNKLRPDIYVSRHGGTSVWATKMGIASVMVADEYSAFGYRGLIDFGYRLIDAVTNRSLARNLAARIKLPYTDWWFEQDGFKFLETDVS